MQIVIDISGDVYQTILATHDNMIFDSDSPYVAIAIKNGTPLPKGHGRLIILSEDKLKEYQIILDFSCQKWISEVDLSNATPTIIEADKEQKDGSDN